MPEKLCRSFYLAKSLPRNSIRIFLGIAIPTLVVILSCSSVKSGVVRMIGERMSTSRWVSSVNLKITVFGENGGRTAITSGHADFKPVWSGIGDKIVFFRALNYGGRFADWKTRLCVVKADGSGFRELSDGRFADFNPTWTRDGSNLVIFNRYAGDGAPDSNEIFLISPDGAMGDEIRISNPSYRFEWAHSGLKDGRIFMDRIDFRAFGQPIAKSFLLTPGHGGPGKYEEIQRPVKEAWHKLSVSPSETKVTYMLDTGNNLANYNGDVLYYADFDAKNLTVSNAIPFTQYRPNCVSEYPRWSADESMIIYDSNCSGNYKMYTYRLSDGATSLLSSDDKSNIMFGNFDSVPQ